MNKKEEILQLADQLIRTRGYNGFSYADIADAVGVRKAAVHHYYPSKADLGLSIVDREIAAVRQQRIAGRQLSGSDQLKRAIGIFYRGNRRQQICLTGSFTAEYLTFTPELRERIAEMCRVILEWMESALEKGREEGGFQFEGIAEDRALLVISALLSGLLLSRVMESTVFYRMIDRLLADMQAGFTMADIIQSNAQSDTNE